MRKPIHNKALKKVMEMERARKGLQMLKVQICVDNKMTIPEMQDFTGMSKKNIQGVFDRSERLSQLHTFSLLARTGVDDEVISRKVKRIWNV